MLQGDRHPTGAVAPTCRREYELVNAIPAGYESDDSWDNLSHTHDHTHYAQQSAVAYTMSVAKQPTKSS